MRGFHDGRQSVQVISVGRTGGFLFKQKREREPRAIPQVQKRTRLQVGRGMGTDS